jgi:hypothetical protein
MLVLSQSSNSHLRQQSCTPNCLFSLLYSWALDQRNQSLAGKFMKTQNSKEFEENCFPWGHTEIKALLICVLSYFNTNGALMTVS